MVCGKKRKRRSDESDEKTDSDSDFEDLKLAKAGQALKGERPYLDEYVTLGELAGRVPPSLMVNINFEKFA